MTPDRVRGGLWALVPAAGSGRRFGGDIPKQYLVAAGKPLIEHALDALLAHPGIEGVVVALADGDPRWPGWTSLHGKPVIACTGGDERADRGFRIAVGGGDGIVGGALGRTLVVRGEAGAEKGHDRLAAGIGKAMGEGGERVEVGRHRRISREVGGRRKITALSLAFRGGPL